MAAPPAKKVKVNSAGSSEEMEEVDAEEVIEVEEECKTISILVREGGVISDIHRIKGYPWRLRLYPREDGKFELFVRCEKFREAELWECEAEINFKNQNIKAGFAFESMDKNYNHRIGRPHAFPVDTELEVEIQPSSDGDKWRSRPTVGLLDPRDGCLVIEEKKMYVNKQSLASQSPYFDRLFNAEFKEKNMAEIPIGDVGAEEFANLMGMIYSERSIADLLKHENVNRIMDLADRFQLKIVEDGVVNLLLSDFSPFSIHERLLIADKRKLACKDRIIASYLELELADLPNAPEYDQLSAETKNAILKKCCGAIARTIRRDSRKRSH